MRPSELPILFEDKYLLAVNKPAGLLSVPIKGSSVVSALDVVNDYLDQRKEHAFAVHRIDRYTSGVILFAKGTRNHELLKHEFHVHAPERRYLAVVEGRMRPPKGELRHYLKLAAKGFRQLVSKRSDKEAVQAELRYEAKEFFPAATVVEVSLVTGLKNQIRVQFAACGHPLIGEHQYVPPRHKPILEFSRQALHAAFLGFKHPGTQEQVEVRAPLDAELRELLKKLAKVR